MVHQPSLLKPPPPARQAAGGPGPKPSRGPAAALPRRKDTAQR